MAIAINSTPDKTAVEGSLYTYSPTADNTAVSWALTGNPTGMTLDSTTTGHISWTPTDDQTNSGTLHLVVTGTDASTGSQDWTVAVLGVGIQITSTPATTATEGQTYTYTPTTAYGTANSWTLDGTSTGMTFDTTTGVLSWNPTHTQWTAGPLTLTAIDTDSSAIQSWSIAVTTVAPAIAVNHVGTPDRGSGGRIANGNTLADYHNPWWLG